MILPKLLLRRGTSGNSASVGFGVLVCSRGGPVGELSGSYSAEGTAASCGSQAQPSRGGRRVTVAAVLLSAAPPRPALH